MGVVHFKIVGREAHPYRKVRSLQMVKAVADHLRAGRAPASVRRFSRELRATPDLCASGYMCYYREAGRRDAST
jgi:putative protease